MKLMVQATQAVAVELLGVLLVVWMLFGFASWGLQSATGQGTSWNRQLADALSSRTSLGNHSAAPHRISARSADKAEEDERIRYVAQRLDHYGRVLKIVSRNMGRSAWQQATQPETDFAPPATPTTSLAGSF